VPEAGFELELEQEQELTLQVDGALRDECERELELTGLLVADS
jgi:hypothetical protein